MINRVDSKLLLKLLVSEMYLFHHIDPTVRADLTFREFHCLMKSDIGLPYEYSSAHCISD